MDHQLRCARRNRLEESREVAIERFRAHERETGKSDLVERAAAGEHDAKDSRREQGQGLSQQRSG